MQGVAGFVCSGVAHTFASLQSDKHWPATSVVRSFGGPVSFGLIFDLRATHPNKQPQHQILHEALETIVNITDE
jgi:hypothetical protein